MKIKSFIHRLASAKTACVLLTPFFLSQAASGVIIVEFLQDGPNVRVSFSGSLDLSDTPLTDTSLNSAGLSSGFLLSQDTIQTFGPSYGIFDTSIGTPSLISLSASSFSASTPGPSFGFTGSQLRYNAVHVTGGSIGAVTELTADPLRDFFVIENSTRADINATIGDTPEGATLWALNGPGGDRFVFSSPGSVPEPSTGLLVGVALVGLLRRRR